MPLFKRSKLTEQLVHFLQHKDKGHCSTYKELSRAVDEEIGPASHKLRYARYILTRDFAQVWVAEQPRIGVRRLTDPEIAERLPRWWMNGARRRLDRGGDESMIVETGKLSLDEQARFSVNSIQQQLALQSLSKPTLRHLEKVARGTSNDLPAFNILEWAISLTPRRKAPE